VIHWSLIQLKWQRFTSSNVQIQGSLSHVPTSPPWCL
jgi:hypothetical protein